MAFKLLIKEEANADIVKAYSYYETKKTHPFDIVAQILTLYWQQGGLV